MKYLIGIIGLIVIGAFIWNTMGGDTAATPSAVNHSVNGDGMNVVTSIYPLAYLGEQIVGDAGSVTNIGAGQDPHDFRPTAQDIQAMLDADLVVLQGAELEPWGDEVLEQLNNAGTPVVIATADLELFEMGEGNHDEHKEEDHHDEHEDEHHDDEEEHGDHGHEEEGDHHDEHDNHEDEHGHNHGSHDPHTWLDPVLMQDVAVHITESLVAVDPDNRSLYEQNLTALQASLASLDNEYQNTLSNCSVNEVITSHDAFGYIARRYGFEIHAIGGLSTQDTPSAVTLAELKEEAEEGITTILLEENSVAAYGETLARETGLATGSISPIVYNIPQGQDYLDVMRSNLESFKTALSCNG